MKITADSLNGTHIGKIISVAQGTHLGISGPLKSVEHDADLIWDAALCSPPRFALGRSHVRLTFLDPDAQVTVSPRTEIEVAE